MSEEFALEIKQDYERAKCLYEKIKKTCYMIITVLGLSIIGLISSYIVTGERVTQHSRDIQTIKQNYVDRWTMLMLIQAFQEMRKELVSRIDDAEDVEQYMQKWDELCQQMIQGTHYTTRGHR
jgi:uncharacterized protein (UPF0305 family)